MLCADGTARSGRVTEWDARSYNRVSALQRWLAEKSLASLTLDGGERVLDLGCGDGTITAEIAGRVPRGSVLGVDASHAMVTFASERFSRTTHPNLAFQVGDAAQLDVGDRFDLIVSFNCLHWVRDQAAALGGIRAALAPSGRTHLRLVCEGSRRSLEDVIEDTRSTAAWAPYFPRPSSALPPPRRRMRTGRWPSAAACAPSVSTSSRRSGTSGRGPSSSTSPRRPSSNGRGASRRRGTVRSSTTCSTATGRSEPGRRARRTCSRSIRWKSCCGLPEPGGMWSHDGQRKRLRDAPLSRPRMPHRARAVKPKSYRSDLVAALARITSRAISCPA